MPKRTRAAVSRKLLQSRSRVWRRPPTLDFFFPMDRLTPGSNNSTTVPYHRFGFRGNFRYGKRTPSMITWSARMLSGASKPFAPPLVT